MMPTRGVVPDMRMRTWILDHRRAVVALCVALVVLVLLNLALYARTALDARAWFGPFQSLVSGSPPRPTPQTNPLFPMGSYQVSVTRNVAYGPLHEEVLDLCQPTDADGPRPGLILIHSSGFTGSDKSDGDTQPTCTNFASQGFVVANVNYRLAPANIWPAPLVDVQLAVRWLRDHASAYDLDPQRVCATGPSFGGYLAVFLGVLQQVHPGDEAYLYPGESPAVSCVSDFFGPVDYMPPASGVTGDLISTSQGILGGATPQSDPDLYRDASPIYDVTPQSAPMIIVQGSEDGTVAPEQSQELFQALQANHVFVEYLSYVGDHELSGLNAAQINALWTQVLDFHIAYQHP